MQNESNNFFKTKNRFVYDFLLANILDGKFKPGEKIIIREVSKKLNISDIPVREAIRKLETEGLINIVPHVGAKVIKVNKEEIGEIFVIRAELEGLATRLASDYMKENDFDDLRKIINEQRKAVKLKNFEKYIELNKQFHMRMYQCSGNKMLLKMITDLWLRSRMARIVFITSNNRLRKSCKEHELILEALIKRDSNLAAEEVKKQKISSWYLISKSVKFIV